MTRYFYDTEFYEDGADAPIRPISIGIVSEDGRELYRELPFDWDQCGSDWLKQNVKPYLDGQTKTREEIADDVRTFVGVGGSKPQWWGYYADYDHVVLAQIFGTMMDLPEGWPMYTRDLKQLCDDIGNPKLPAQDSQEHNALADARWNRYIFHWLQDNRP